MTISKGKLWSYLGSVFLGGTLIGMLAIFPKYEMRSIAISPKAETAVYCPEFPIVSGEGTGSASVQVYPERFGRRANITVMGSTPMGVDPSCILVDVSGGGIGRPFDDTRVYQAGDGKFIAKCIRVVKPDASPTINVSIRRAYKHCADVSAANIRFAVEFECD